MLSTKGEFSSLFSPYFLSLSQRVRGELPWGCSSSSPKADILFASSPVPLCLLLCLSISLSQVTPSLRLKRGGHGAGGCAKAIAAGQVTAPPPSVTLQVGLPQKTLLAVLVLNSRLGGISQVSRLIFPLKLKTQDSWSCTPSRWSTAGRPQGRRRLGPGHGSSGLPP